MAELWFIRHFRTAWNASGQLQGQRDIPLESPLGADCRSALASNLTALADQTFAEVLTSPLARARATAVHHGFPHAQADADLAEIAFGDWEGRVWADLEAAHPGIWATAPHTLPLGERFEDFTARINRIRDRIAAAPGPVLVFGHGAWLGALRSLAGGGGGRDLSRFICRNGELVRVGL